MTINCNLTKSDYQAMRKYVIFRYRKLQWYYVFLLACVLVLSWYSNKPDATMTEKICELVAMVVLWLLFMATFLLWLRFSGGKFRGSVGAHVFEVNDDGFSESHADGKRELRLAGIRHIGESPGHFFIISTTGTCHVLPKKDFQDYDALHSLQAKVAKHGA